MKPKKQIEFDCFYSELTDSELVSDQLRRELGPLFDDNKELDSIADCALYYLADGIKNEA